MHFSPLMSNFNPRSRKESDPRTGGTAPVPCIFQSTLSQGERRLRVLFVRILIKNFNPRSRKESDVAKQWDFEKTNQFQSTLSQGERLIGASTTTGLEIFQSTLSQGERR